MGMGVAGSRRRACGFGQVLEEQNRYYVTDAHDQKVTIHLMTHVPEHSPREEDPHYHLFNAAKRRMHKMGLLKCAIAGCVYGGTIELHHSKIEFSLQGGVDLNKFNTYYGLHLESDEEFREYIESEGNLEPLCAVHHRTLIGVHRLPEPFWVAVRVWKEGMAPPAETIAA